MDGHDARCYQCVGWDEKSFAGDGERAGVGSGRSDERDDWEVEAESFKLDSIEV